MNTNLLGLEAAVKEANLGKVLSTAARIGGKATRLGSDLTGVARGQGVARNATNLGKSMLFPNFEKATTNIAKDLGMSEHGALRTGKAVGKTLALPTIGYTVNSLLNAHHQYRNSNDAVKDMAEAALHPTEDIQGAAKIMGYKIPDADKLVSAAGKKMDPGLEDTLEAAAKGGLPGGLWRHYVYGKDGLGGNNWNMNPELSSKINKGVLSLAKSTAHNAGAAMHNVPEWHKGWTTLFSPGQRVGRAMLPGDKVPEPVTRALTESELIQPNEAELSGAYERISNAGRKKWTEAAKLLKERMEAQRNRRPDWQQ